jgi:DNA repair photolyase
VSDHRSDEGKGAPGNGGALFFRNRIIGYGEERPESLIPNPENWRDHSKSQIKTMESALREVGWVQDIIVNKTTGRLVDGHMRAGIAVAMKQATVPVKYVDLTEAEERKVLATLDPLAYMADGNLDRYLKLLASVTAESEPLKKLMADTGGVDAAMISGGGESKAPARVEQEASLNTENRAYPLYCPIPAKLDVTTGKCPHGCLYCFIEVSPAGRSWGSSRPISKSSIDAALFGLKDGEAFEVGTCNDPGIAVAREPLVHLLKKARERGQVAYLSTKNPMAAALAVTAAGAQSSAVVRASFSVPRWADKIEPGAPTVEERIKGMLYARNEGIGTVARFCPLFLGTDLEEIERVVVESKAEVLMVEPLRFSATGMAYFRRIESALPGEFSFDAYIERWGNKTKKFHDAVHWYAMNDDLVREEMLALSALAKRLGVHFGICGWDHGWPNLDLGTQPVCCKTSGISPSTVYDELSFTCRWHRRDFSLSNSVLRSLKSGSRERSAELERLAAWNDGDVKTFWKDSE